MKYRKGTALLIATALIASISFTGCGKRDSAAVIITGSTTMELLTRSLANAYREKNSAEIIVTSGGSHNGIKALIEGSCTIADSSARISAIELEQAKKKGVVIREFAVGRGMIVPIVHLSNPVRNVSLKHLERIYSGALTDWTELGWKGPIEAVGRDESSGTHDVWRAVVLRGAPYGAGIAAVASNSMVLAHVARTPGAIGYVEYAFLNAEVRALLVGGIDPVAVADGRLNGYPLTRTLYLYTSETCFTGETKKFIVFALSSQGQEAIKKAGFLPAAPPR